MKNLLILVLLILLVCVANSNISLREQLADKPNYIIMPNGKIVDNPGVK